MGTRAASPQVVAVTDSQMSPSYISQTLLEAPTLGVSTTGKSVPKVQGVAPRDSGKKASIMLTINKLRKNKRGEGADTSTAQRATLQGQASSGHQGSLIGSEQQTTATANTTLMASSEIV